MSAGDLGVKQGVRRSCQKRALVMVVQMLSLISSLNSLAQSTAFSLNDVAIRGFGQLERGRANISPSVLYMAKTAKKKKAKKKANSGGSGGGLKGFGSVGATKGASVDLDRSKEARKFYDFMEAGDAGDNLNRCAIGNFPISDDFQLRGVAALKPVKKGDPIIRIPYELAINLGREGADPSVPAVNFLKDYCETLSPSTEKEQSRKAAYYEMLPPYGGADCRGSTDFFSEQALNELQAPLVVEETKKRKERTIARFQSEIAPNLENFPAWIDGSPVTEDHLAWAVWLITSRVLTVQGDAEEGKSYRLLIPFLDMCNHDRSSSHILSGRAVPGGELKVVAGSPVKEGDQINICYGGGMAGNDRFLQDYGFLDTSSNSMAYDMVAQQLLGKRRLVEGAGAGRLMAEVDRQRTIDQLKQTTVEEDKALLEGETDPSLAAAYNYRIGVKTSLAKFDGL